MFGHKLGELGWHLHRCIFMQRQTYTVGPTVHQSVILPCTTRFCTMTRTILLLWRRTGCDDYCMYITPEYSEGLLKRPLMLVSVLASVDFKLP